MSRCFSFAPPATFVRENNSINTNKQRTTCRATAKRCHATALQRGHFCDFETVLCPSWERTPKLLTGKSLDKNSNQHLSERSSRHSHKLPCKKPPRYVLFVLHPKSLTPSYHPDKPPEGASPTIARVAPYMPPMVSPLSMSEEVGFCPVQMRNPLLGYFGKGAYPQANIGAVESCVMCGTPTIWT
jgi:hypothetical protein